MSGRKYLGDSIPWWKHSSSVCESVSSKRSVPINDEWEKFYNLPAVSYVFHISTVYNENIHIHSYFIHTHTHFYEGQS